MGHTNSTPNLHLPQFIGSDKPTWLSDVNGAMVSIDTAYGTIEAQASSAATAAAGAVTTASAAQTAADAAATAAATAGTNASQALSTANNAASVALQAQTDASEALDRVNGEVLATVEANGETLKNVLNSLVTSVLIPQLTDNSKIVLLDSYGNRYVFVLFRRSATDAVFAHVNANSSSWSVTWYSCKGDENTAALVDAIGAGGFTYTDKGSDVQNNVTLTLYK